MQEKVRCFLAVPITEFPDWMELQRSLIDADNELRIIKFDNLHVTILFLGDKDYNLISELETILIKQLQNYQSFTIKLQGLGYFQNNNQNFVIWCGLKDDGQMGTINRIVINALKSLNIPNINKQFHPHLSLARKNNARPSKKLLHLIKDSQFTDYGSFKCDCIDLISSELTPQGPIYTLLKRIDLCQ